MKINMLHTIFGGVFVWSLIELLRSLPSYLNSGGNAIDLGIILVGIVSYAILGGFIGGIVVWLLITLSLSLSSYRVFSLVDLGAMVVGIMVGMVCGIVYDGTIQVLVRHLFNRLISF